jgi:hypothetical protein
VGGRPTAGLLVALALAYLAIVASRAGELQGDEWRYVFYAENLLQGYYSPPETTFVWNGPGYPLFLAPFAALDLPWAAARYANVALMLGAVAYCRALVASFAPRWALASAAALGLYPPLLFFLHQLYSETLAAFLLLAFAFHLRLAVTRPSTVHTVAAGCLLGALALTKILFGPVMLVWGGLLLVGVAVARSSRLVRAAVMVAIALALCAPYLAYTRALTGRAMYWGSASGMSLYFMSSPHPGESGDWYHHDQVRRRPRLRAHHLATLERIGRFDEVPEGAPLGEMHFLCTDEADAEFKRLAVENIRAHPAKYAANWAANVSRLFFDVPFSYGFWPRDPLVFAANGPILALFVGALVLAWRRRIRPDLGLSLALVLVGGALAGNSLLSAVGRYSAPVMPVLALWAVSVLAAGSSGSTTISNRP